MRVMVRRLVRGPDGENAVHEMELQLPAVTDAVLAQELLIRPDDAEWGTDENEFSVSVLQQVNGEHMFVLSRSRVTG